MNILIVVQRVVDLGFLTFETFLKLGSVNKCFRKHFISVDKMLNVLTESYIRSCNQSKNRWRESRLSRFNYWFSLVMSTDVRIYISQYFNCTTKSERLLFYKIHSQFSPSANCLSTGIIGEIMRDVRRTFPSHSFFRKGQRGSVMLTRILKAFSSARPDIGYCQGMNFVVGLLILVRLNEGYSKSSVLTEHQGKSPSRTQSSSSICDDTINPEEGRYDGSHDGVSSSGGGSVSEVDLQHNIAPTAASVSNAGLGISNHSAASVDSEGAFMAYIEKSDFNRYHVFYRILVSPNVIYLLFL